MGPTAPRGEKRIPLRMKENKRCFKDDMNLENSNGGNYTS
jgi:hypothetical protein